jgi:hypothetical protein
VLAAFERSRQGFGCSLYKIFLMIIEKLSRILIVTKKPTAGKSRELCFAALLIWSLFRQRGSGKKGRWAFIFVGQLRFLMLIFLCCVFGMIHPAHVIGFWDGGLARRPAVNFHSPTAGGNENLVSATPFFRTESSGCRRALMIE